jgi:drug/metabolite transporter (DMT)-like permease
MDLKKIASVAFGIAFLMAIVLFTGNGRSYISIPVAKMIFIIAGAIVLFLNLLSFRTGKNGSVFSFLYWAGSLIVFLGLIFLLMHWPYGYYIVIAGMAVLGISFIVPEKIIEQGKNDSDLLDDLNN